MKKLLLLLALCANFTYAETNDSTAFTEPTCKTNEVAFNEQTLNTRVCIRRPFLKPIEYEMAVNGQNVFSRASNEGRVRVNARINEGTVQGACLPILQINAAMSSTKAARFSTLPADLVSACSIKGDAADEAMPFIEGGQCSIVLGAYLDAKRTPAWPIEVARICKLWLEKKEIFSAEFSG